MHARHVTASVSSGVISTDNVRRWQVGAATPSRPTYRMCLGRFRGLMLVPVAGRATSPVNRPTTNWPPCGAQKRVKSASDGRLRHLFDTAVLHSPAAGVSQLRQHRRVVRDDNDGALFRQLPQCAGHCCHASVVQMIVYLIEK